MSKVIVDDDLVIVKDVRTWTEISDELVEKRKGLWEKLFKQDLYNEGEENTEDKQSVRNS